jgi:16S rRNA (guanine527-N7)-methyltransferase
MNQDREPLPLRVDGLPALPAEALVVLDAGLEALTLGDLPDPIRTGLIDHLRLLLAWNQSINLTAIRDPEMAVREHILDSLTALPILREARIETLLDLGSGGGYPGLPLALALPARRALLVESVGKKATFLAAAAVLAAEAVLAAGHGTGDGASEVDVFSGRVEALAADARHRERWQAVVARAIAPLAELAEIALPLVARGGILVAWKRLPLDTELAAAAPGLRLLGGAQPVLRPVTLAGLEDHVLVIVEKLKATPPAYPRDPAQRRRRPLAAGERLPSP